MINKNKGWTDTVFGKKGELVWCLLSLYPLVPIVFIWVCVLLYDAIQTGRVMAVIMLFLGLLFVGYHGVRVTFSFFRLIHVIQKVTFNASGSLEGSYYFNRKFTFNLDDVANIEMLDVNQNKNSIGSYSEMVFTIRLKDGHQLFVLKTMDDYGGLFNKLRAKTNPNEGLD